MAAPSRSLINLSGLILSVTCVIHCLLMPLCLASLPNWGLAWLVSPRVHQMLALLGVAIGIGTLVPGWRTHRRSSVLLLALAGLAFMNYAAFAVDNCCSAPSRGEASVSGLDCCQQPCCVDQSTQLAADRESTMAVMSSWTDPMLNIWQWLWTHPTAFGAALLAWAHCLNGCCSRRCCQGRSDEMFAATSFAHALDERSPRAEHHGDR